MRLGIDIGSTTIKCALFDDNEKLIYNSYQRHSSQIKERLSELLNIIHTEYKVNETYLAISGSAGMGTSERLGIEFIQEVYATRHAANHFLDKPDCIIELGGEDAKILFLSNGLEVRMNGTCAGGTGAFIDQMAQLLNMDVEAMNEAAKNYQKLYNIASRCGVFAKSDIQPLINQGALKEDLAASIYYSVVNQTVGGLAQGRKIDGRVVYLGGPLTFNSELRKAFDNTLKLEGICPENSLYYVAMGTALLANEKVALKDLLDKLDHLKAFKNYYSLKPLFNNEAEYEEFKKRHAKNAVKIHDGQNIKGDVYLGVDAGSTTLKLVIINKDKEILYSSYRSNKGNTLDLVKNELISLYQNNPKMHIVSSCVTGYGEELIKNAMGLDYGLVETQAHLKAALKFMPNVDFIIDIGGQDIKCFKIKNGNLDNLFLNEACSSGCGSFLQTFATALGYDIDSFAKLGLFAKNPVDLGSRCTVFMNSSVKQAQKDGATIEDISAGLSISVIKNALYKVIRTTNLEELGTHIITQGGTFLNDAVLRAFEIELGIDVTRPNISGLMGAYGSALYALDNVPSATKIVSLKDLLEFKNTTKQVNCGLCNNHCQLTINDFGGGKRYISGNRCDRPISKRSDHKVLNIYDYKRSLLESYKPKDSKRNITIGLPMALNMYELLPFWYTFFSELGFKVVNSGRSSLDKYHHSQNSIPSDTVCFPAKLTHAHIDTLIDEKIPYIFYPCLTYNVKEKDTDNSYNCPVVAYYPEVIEANLKRLIEEKITFIYDHFSLANPKTLGPKLYECLKRYFADLTLKEVKEAVKKAFIEYYAYLKKIEDYGQKIIKEANEHNAEIIVLCGRPYHIDPIINHGIDRLIAGFGIYVISEDALHTDYDHSKLEVLNQWTYHSRLYSAAHYIKDKKNMDLVQLVSFGCGVDAITTDEIRAILEGHDKIYTQLKIDEITNLGAVKIRLRSLLAALGKEKDHE